MVVAELFVRKIARGKDPIGDIASGAVVEGYTVPIVYTLCYGAAKNARCLTVVDIVDFSGYVLLLGGGGVMAIYLYGSNMRSSGKFLGVTSLALGLVGFISSLLGIDGVAYNAIWLTFGFSLLGVFYIEFGRRLAVVFLAAPFYVLALTFLLPLPFLLLFLTLTLEIGLLDAYRLSRSGFTRIRTEDMGVRTLLAPFVTLDLFARWMFRGRVSGNLMFASYSLLPVATVISVFLLWLLAGASDAAYVLVVVTGFYFAAASYNFGGRMTHKD